MDCPELTSGTLTLDLPVVEDAQAWRLALDSEVLRWFEFPGRPRLENVRAHLAYVQRQWSR